MTTAMHTHDSTPTRKRLRLRPRSVTGLLVICFALVVLPMLMATLFSISYVDQLTEQSEHLVLRGVQVTRVSRHLNTVLTSMERSARQYKIVQEPKLVERFNKQKQLFDQALERLHQLHLPSMPSWGLNKLQAQAETLAVTINQHPAQLADKLPLFTTMHQETALIIEQGRVFIGSQLQQLQQTAHNARLFLLLCLVMLVPGVILLAIICTILIARPVRQIIRAIARLGQGDLDTPITVAAPSAEFDALSHRLDWMRRRLATLETERNQFLQHMSHELKTPLASIREGSEILSDGTLGELSSAQAEVANIIQHNSLDLVTLIDNLLDFSARQRQQVQLEYTHFELTALCADVVRRQHLPIDNKNLSVKLPQQPLALTADRDRVHLILDNLLTNAVKFSPPGGTISINATHDGHTLTLHVCDQGPGIPAAARECIFDPFYQDNSRAQATHIHGTGIGLSVVRECVHAHDGHIEIHASAHGGACFCITLPTNGETAHAR